jgi:quercetin dioxygenase-like cupin family protein
MEDLFEKLATSEKAVATVLRKGTNFKVLAIAFKKGMLFPKHTTPLPAKITVMQGTVAYQEAGKTVALTQYQSHQIPVGVPHWVEATEDAWCLVMQGGE